MNYSTLKKTVVFSFVSLMGVSLASAQTDSTKSMKKMAMSDTTTTAKVFGGAGQYSTFSIGINAGVTSGQIPFMLNAANTQKFSLGYGASLRDQLSHIFSLRLDYTGGTVEGYNEPHPGTGAAATPPYTYGTHTFYKTTFNSGSLSGVFDIGSASFLHRKSGVLFYASGGLGLDFYKPEYGNVAGQQSAESTDVKYPNTVKELTLPIGAGVKFKLTDALDLNLGYTATLVKNYNFSAYKTFDPYPVISHYAYAYGGLEYTFGTKTKPSLEWVNPVAMMYDELYDEALRQEVAALKGRVTNVETAISDLKKDSDGDGVADQFDKCPNTPAGTVVDGSGCPIIFPKPDTIKAPMAPAAAAYSNIQFEFDSSVLKTSSYPVLDATSADLRSSSATLTLAGYASSEGTAAHNMRLSKDRANSVKTYLVNSGVDAKRLKVKGYGETHPIASNDTDEGRIANRRVEFHK